MKKIVNTATRFLFPYSITYGFYIVVHGHLTPGGGFQGGAVIATSFALVFVSNSYENVKEYFKKVFFNLFELAGLLFFVLLGYYGIFSDNSFLFNWFANTGCLFGNPVSYGINQGDLNTGGTIPLLNIAVGFEVLGALSLIIYYLFSYSKHSREDE